MELKQFHSTHNQYGYTVIECGHVRDELTILAILGRQKACCSLCDWKYTSRAESMVYSVVWQ